MKKRILSLLLALCLLLSTSALAAQDSSDNFVRLHTYSGQFSDLATDSVFYSNVSALYEYGLSIGKADGTYGLRDPLTVGQAVIFAARIRSLYRTGDPEAGAAAHRTEGQLTAMPYLLYLVAEGIPLDTVLETQLTSFATRAQMAHILANILPEDVLPSIHSEQVTEAYATRKAITDVTEYTPYFQDILALYRKGVAIGSDSIGSFLPDDPITRGAAAAMLTRMVDPSLRVTPQWDSTPIPDVQSLTFGDLVSPGTYIASPATTTEMDESIRYMLSANSNTLELHYPNVTAVQAREVMMTALSVVKTYCEQGYNAVSCNYTPSGKTTLTFSTVNAEEQTQSYRQATLEAAIAVHNQLWEAGLITANMTELEKALAYYVWVCENCVYDNAAGDDSISHTAYSLFHLGTAVCDGYTGAYNLLLKLEGIDCSVLFNDTHIWTTAYLDGVEYHIDTTWGDTENGANAVYFAMTLEQSRLYHTW